MAISLMARYPLLHYYARRAMLTDERFAFTPMSVDRAFRHDRAAGLMLSFIIRARSYFHFFICHYIESVTRHYCLLMPPLRAACAVMLVIFMLIILSL